MKRSEKEEVPKVVAAIIFDEKGRVLVSQRALNAKLYPGKWQVPGGKVERGENYLDALKREVKEETDLEVVSINNLLIRQFEVAIYQAEVVGKAKAMEPTKINTEWEYMEIEELKKKDTTPTLSELLKGLTKL
jgi:8-oxo-dGTP diphosphatase